MIRRMPRSRARVSAPSPDGGPERPDGGTEHTKLAREIAANMAESVVAVRATDGVIVYTNESADQLFGYGAGELLGRHISVVNAPTELTPEERAQELVNALERDRSWHGSVHNVRKDGSHFWCEVSVSEFEHPELGTLWIAVQREITQRMAHEANLRGTMERYRTAFERTPVATALLTEDLRLADVNDAFCALTGYGVDELMGKPLGQLTHRDDSGLDPAFFASVFSAGGPSARAERRWVTKQRAPVVVTVEVVGVIGESGRTPFAIATVTPRES